MTGMVGGWVWREIFAGLAEGACDDGCMVIDDDTVEACTVRAKILVTCKKFTIKKVISQLYGGGT